ncbi:hypothetical protein CALCODRAFT_518222 [Calocera cornea HHB12733]|uniref:Uncharacterized protein n=1 Tax=Calocera cornea HHB12733 TaxID=1353952 RepID=A0A165F6M4_9BASI|nr:hypothetical protein CALCODRAFT_518222 [Calocera cornea HHB12733]
MFFSKVALLFTLSGAAVLASAAPTSTGGDSRSASLSLRDVELSELVGELYARSLSGALDVRDFEDEDMLFSRTNLANVGDTVESIHNPGGPRGVVKRKHLGPKGKWLCMIKWTTGPNKGKETGYHNLEDYDHPHA